jgi:hypothetical protein
MPSRAVTDGQTSTDEIILDINNQKAADRTNNLKVKKTSLDQSKETTLKPQCRTT